MENTAQPTQELVHPSYVAVMVEHPLEEDRQLVDDQENRLILCGAITEQLFPVTPPAPGIQSRTDLHAKIVCTDFLDVVAHPPFHPDGETRRDRANRMYRPRDIRDRILRAVCSFNIGEEVDPAFGLEPPPEFLDNTGLSHAPLSGQQNVIAVSDLRFQYLQLAITIEKVAAAYPTAGG